MSYGESKIGTPWRGYYITAYGIAVKHGFKGTEEEWLESLVGKAVEIRYNDVTNVLEWSYAGEDVWTELLSLEDLQTEVVAQTLAQAEAAKQAAQNAQTAAEAAQSAAEAAQQEAEQNAGITQADASITQTNVQLTQEAKAAAEAAQQAAQNAQQAAEAAGTDAEESATLSKSWAVGGTGTRPGEDTNNAEYWAGQAAIAAGGGVLTFNGRTGNVTTEQGDYTPDQVGAADKTLSNLTDYQKAIYNIGAMPLNNLVDNGYFVGGGTGYGVFPVCQKGGKPDRWAISANYSGYTLDQSGIILTRNQSGGSINAIQKKGASISVGDTVTIAIVTAEYGLQYATKTVTAAMQYLSADGVSSENGYVAFGVIDGEPTFYWGIGSGTKTGTVCTITAVGLFFGKSQGLAYKNISGEPVLYPPRPYGDVLFDCQAYYENSWFPGTISSGNQIIGGAFDVKTADVRIEFKVPKISVPVINTYGAGGSENPRVYAGSGYIDIPSLANVNRGGINAAVLRASVFSSNVFSVDSSVQFHFHWEAICE